MIDAPALKVRQVRIRYRCMQAMELPRWKGALFRGGLGYALRDSLCDPSCADEATCARPCLFRTLFQPQAGAALPAGMQEPPRPYVIRPPLDEQRAFAAGDTLAFATTVFGPAADALPELIAGFTHLGLRGLGAQRGKAQLADIALIDVLAEEASPLSLLAPPNDHPTLAELVSQRSWHAGPIQVRLLTPLHLKQGGTMAKHITLPLLVDATLRRLRMLAAVYADAPWAIRPELAQHLRVLADQCQPSREHQQQVDWTRTSGATKQVMQIPGIVGSLTFPALPAELQALLWLGSLINLGKAAVFGHGWINLVPLNPTHA